MAGLLAKVDVSQNHYDVLEVDARTVTRADMKRSFRRLCLKYHPDKGGPQAAEHFHRIKVAYDTLSDPKKKMTFDHAYFYARHSAPRNFKRIPDPSPSEPSTKRPRVDQEPPNTSGGSSPTGVNSPTESRSGSVSPPSDDAAVDVTGPLEDLTISRLKSIAKGRGIDVAKCLEKSDMIAAIRKTIAGGTDQQQSSKTVPTDGQEKPPADGSTESDPAVNSKEPAEPTPARPSIAGTQTAEKGKGVEELLRRQTAYQRELSKHKTEIGLSSDSLKVSTSLVEKLSRLQKILDSSAAYATDHTSALLELRSRIGAQVADLGHDLGGHHPGNTITPRGRFSSAIRNHLTALTSGAHALAEAKRALSGLSDRFGDIMKDIQQSDAELIVSTRAVSSEIRRYQELLNKMGKDDTVAVGLSVEPEAEGREGVREEHGSKKKLNVNRLAGFRDTPGSKLPFDRGSTLGKPWSDLIAPGARKRQAAASSGRKKTPTKRSVPTKIEAESIAHNDGHSSSTTTSTAPEDQAGDASGKTAEEGKPSRANVEDLADDTAADGGIITVRIPKSWKPGRRIQFPAGDGKVRMVPPESCVPGDLMVYDTTTKQLRKRGPPAVVPLPSAGRHLPKVVWEEGKEFVVLE
ncbi:hypothetical protein FOL47_008541 [Perkinsus chesapeaki]|uniref:J domain-containing protein n=1 Tax=Perkinsus chesapeaki TaxID=330153 RepID=A0A7J6LDE2_PERCH|nr:hypothetical protein FOL47_008541 [Perkinsus chesapeaki]